MLCLVLVMALAAVVISTPTSRADPSTIPWFSYGTVSSNSNFDRHTPVSLSDNDGHIWVFYYTANHVVGSTNINVTRYITSAGIFGLPSKEFDVQVNDFANTNLVSGSYPFTATRDGSGNLYVAWTKVPGALGNEVYVSKSTDGGETWQSAVPVRAASTNYDDIWPSVGVTPAGTVYVSWTQIWGSFYNITVASSTNGGNTFTGVMNISGQGLRGLAVIDSMGIDSHGRIYVAYIGETIVGGLNLHINVTRSDDGITWTAPYQITPSSTFGEYPNLVVDAQDRVHVVWFDYRGYLTTGTLTAWYTRSDDRGASWIPQEPISQGVSSPNTYAYLSVHGNEVMVVWTGSQLATGVLSYSLSEDGGNSWYPEQTFYPGYNVAWATPAADENGTFYAGVQDSSTTTESITLLLWLGPPSPPTNLAVVSGGTGSLTVSWTAPPEKNVAGYHVYMSTDGVTYTLVADTLSTTYTATGLANGTYYFRVEAMNSRGTNSVPTAPVLGTVGPTAGQLNAEIQSLQTQIAALQTQLATANSDLAALQTQLSSLQTQLTNLQNSQAASNSATAAKLAQLQDQLNQTRADLAAAQAAQATQSMALINTVLAVVIIVLLVLILVVQMRKPKGPQLMMAQPGQAPPNKPEDEL